MFSQYTDLVIWVIIPSVFMLLIIGLIVWYFCFKRGDQNNEGGQGYTVAMSNRLFKVYFNTLSIINLIRHCMQLLITNINAVVIILRFTG